MRIDRLRVENFKGFERKEFAFHPEFNLVVGDNGSGKTSVLDALAVAAGSWMLGIRDQHSRHIRTNEVRLVGFETSTGVNWEPQYPCVVDVDGRLATELVEPTPQPELFARDEVPINWSRRLSGLKGRTTRSEAEIIKKAAEDAAAKVMTGRNVTLPLISYYGTGRLWDQPRSTTPDQSIDRLKDQKNSRLVGYQNSVNPRLSVEALKDWIFRQWVMALLPPRLRTPALTVVVEALVRNIQGATNLTYDLKLNEVVIEFKDSTRQPFSNLSDGQRGMLALVGDIAQKAATLNPHFGEDILAKTPGIVLIDELDLHLHPKWQRHVIEDLRTTFPKIQFICTTHSPFLIQSLRSSEELVMLDGQSRANLGNEPIQTIAHDIQGVENTETSARYDEMKSVARDYLEILEDAAMAPEDKLEEYKRRLAESIAPYADNPAFQAFLEMKRTVKLGE